MKLDRLRGGEVLAGAGGALLLATMFLPWFGNHSPFCVEFAGFPCGHDFSAWQAFGFTDLVLLLAAICGLATAVAGTNAKTDTQITSASVTVPVALLGTLLTLYRVFEPPGNLDPRFGLFVGLGASAALTFGAWRAVRDERPSRVLRQPSRRPRPRTE
jgi:hypothetical protein